MLNRIAIINSELYSKATILIGDAASIQIAAENNVGKSSFLNALNFLYIPDKEQMRFEDNRRLSESIKHYFSNSLNSYIVFEIRKGGYYSILVKATPESTIEYYKIAGAYNEAHFVELLPDGKFRIKEWRQVLESLVLDNPTYQPVQLTGEELYSQIYSTDKGKNPVVHIKREVKRKGRGFTNSFTDIYRDLIKTSKITEQSFKDALLVADGKQDVQLGVFTNDSLGKIDDFEKKSRYLATLRAVRPDFEKLKMANGQFEIGEAVLGKLKYSFLKRYDEQMMELTARLASDGPLAMEIRSLETKVSITLKRERDDLVTERALAEQRVRDAKSERDRLAAQLAEIADYEPADDNLMFAALLQKTAEQDKRRADLEASLTQLDKGRWTARELTAAINQLEAEMKEKERRVEQNANLLYQNLSSDAQVVRQAYAFLKEEVAHLDRSKIIRPVSDAQWPLTFFDGRIDVSQVPVKAPPTVEELQAEIEAKGRELTDKIELLKAATSRQDFEQKLEEIKAQIAKANSTIQKVRNKPSLRASIADIEHQLQVLLPKEKHNAQVKIDSKQLDIEKAEVALGFKKKQYEQDEALQRKIGAQYNYFQARYDVFEVEEVLDEPFEVLHEKFEVTYTRHRDVRDSRQRLKDDINRRLNKDVSDVKMFVKQVEEEIAAIPQLDDSLAALLTMLSHEIGSPTAQFLSRYEEFKTFVYRRYNAKLAEYPVSNIREVKVRLDEVEDLVADLQKIQHLKIGVGLDFDNAHAAGREALERRILESKGKPIGISQLFSVRVEITKVHGEHEEIDLAKQVESRGTNIVLKLYLFMNILKELVHGDEENKVVLYVDELDAIGQRNVARLNEFCRRHHFVPIYAAPRPVGGVEKYYIVDEPVSLGNGAKPKISFGERQRIIAQYPDAQ